MLYATARTLLLTVSALVLTGDGTLTWDKPILYWIFEGDPRGGC